MPRRRKYTEARAKRLLLAHEKVLNEIKMLYREAEEIPAPASIVWAESEATKLHKSLRYLLEDARVGHIWLREGE